jgi:hypothetical protein
MSQTKIGLVLAALLGVSDIAILGALGDDDKPPIAIVVSSVALGIATLALVAMSWRTQKWPLMVALIILRALSGLGDLAAFGEDAAVVTISMVFLVLTVVDIYLLRKWIKKPSTVSQ